MIIEIKDLPIDRKVKHITFDITFEEDGSPIIKSEPTYIPMQPPVVTSSKSSDNVPIAQSREHKDIPPEMISQEF